jgi:hypothetical protein
MDDDDATGGAAWALARLPRSGDLTPVWVPGPEDEALRDLVRIWTRAGDGGDVRRGPNSALPTRCSAILKYMKSNSGSTRSTLHVKKLWRVLDFELPGGFR